MAYQLSVTNGGAIADFTDNDDAMDKLIDFLDGTTAGEVGFLLPVGERWTVLKDDTTTTPGERYVYLKGPGLAAADSIHVNVHITSAGIIHNWLIEGATGFDGGLAFDAQPGRGGGVLLTFSNATMPFWFIASGRRFIVVVQTSGSVSYVGYGGFYLPYATPTEFPYPLFLGGSTGNAAIGFSDTSYRVGNFYDGPSSGALRHTDGTYLAVSAYVGADVSARPSSNVRSTMCWPHDQINDEDYAMHLVENPDGSFPAFPFIFYSTENLGVVYGEIDGVYFSPWGTTGRKFPDTVVIAGDDYLVVNNAYRTAEANALVLLK